MTPSNICSGFRKCSIYPYNPSAFDCGLISSTEGDCSDSSVGRDKDNDGDGGCTNDGGGGDNLEDGSEFSAVNTEILIQQRQEEGYDLYDAEYLRWFEVHHPADIPHDCYHLVSAPADPVADSSPLRHLYHH